MTRVDLTVMGAGVAGLCLAYVAARRGLRVEVRERQAVIGAGASGGLVGALSPHAPDQWNEKKQFQLESLLMAPRFWAGVGACSGMDPGFARVGRLQGLADARALELARRRCAGAADLWGGQAEWRLRPAGGSDWEPASPMGYLVEDTLSARLSPRGALAALQAAVLALGGRVLTGEDRPPAPASAGGLVVWATGWQGLVELGAALGRPCGDGVKGQALALRHAAAGRPQIYHDGLHIIPHADGTVAIGSTSENKWTDAGATDAALEALLVRARAVLPCLAQAPVIERWAGIRPRARSRSPLMGPWPSRAGHYVLNGGFKIGFAMAPLMAERLVALMLDGQDRIPAGFRL